MKLHITLLLMLSSFTLLSCNAQKKIKSNPTISLAQLVQLAPAIIFDQTTEGISTEEKSVLFTEGVSTNWSLSEKTKTYIVTEAKTPFSRVSLFEVLNTKAEPILVVFTENEKTQSIQSLLYNGNKFKPITVMTEIQPADFYTTSLEKSIANKYPNSIKYIYNKTNNSFEATVSTWMNEELEALKIAYRINLVWDMNKFVKRKVNL